MHFKLIFKCLGMSLIIIILLPNNEVQVSKVYCNSLFRVQFGPIYSKSQKPCVRSRPSQILFVKDSLFPGVERGRWVGGRPEWSRPEMEGRADRTSLCTPCDLSLSLSLHSVFSLC